MIYRLLPDAQEDVRDIDDWVLEKFGPIFAERTEVDLHKTFSLLAVHPHMGLARHDILASPFRFFHLKPYWIVYEPGEPLLVHRVYHAARDISRLGMK